MIQAGSHRQHALAGAGLFALGAGAILCVRMYSARISSLAKKTLRSDGEASSLSVNGPQSLGDREVVSPSTEAPPKTPCDGCDCGLGEAPGPLEGSMNAYERHVIICRCVSPNLIFGSDSTHPEDRVVYNGRNKYSYDVRFVSFLLACGLR